MSDREKIVSEALSWIGTPYHEHGRQKGVGVDCLTFIERVFFHAGLVDGVEIPHYSPQWHLHRSRELYIDGLSRYMVEVESPKPADVAVWKFGRTFSHGAIVTEWPDVVQCVKGTGVSRAHALRDALFRDKGVMRPVKFFSFWGA